MHTSLAHFVRAGSKCKDTGPPFNPEFTATSMANFLGNISTNQRGEALIDPYSLIDLIDDTRITCLLDCLDLQYFK